MLLNFFSTEAVRLNHQEETEKAIFNTIADVLRYAPDKEGAGGRPKKK